MPNATIRIRDDKVAVTLTDGRAGSFDDAGSATDFLRTDTAAPIHDLANAVELIRDVFHSGVGKNAE